MEKDAGQVLHLYSLFFDFRWGECDSEITSLDVVALAGLVADGEFAWSSCGGAVVESVSMSSSSSFFICARRRSASACNID